MARQGVKTTFKRGISVTFSLAMSKEILEAFGNIDIYLFDQLMKGRYDNCKQVLDAGCGGGRNIIYFLQNGYEVYGIDRDAAAIEAVKKLAKEIAAHNPPENFRVSTVEDMPFEDASFDLVICSAVLHFAKDHHHFDTMLRAVWRVLRPGGYFFARLASDTGIENLVEAKDNGRYLLPDGSVRFLVNHEMLMNYTQELNAELYEPIKTTNVSNMRCMTTWCMSKGVPAD